MLICKFSIVPKKSEALRISASVRQYRRERGLSQKQLANLCGVDQSQISRFEGGIFSRSGKNLKKVCRYAQIAPAVERDVTSIRTSLRKVWKPCALRSPAARIERRLSSFCASSLRFRDQLHGSSFCLLRHCQISSSSDSSTAISALGRASGDTNVFTAHLSTVRQLECRRAGAPQSKSSSRRVFFALRSSGLPCSANVTGKAVRK